MFERIRKRDGKVVEFQPEKITRAIYKAAVAVGGSDFEKAEELTQKVLVLAEERLVGPSPEIEDVQDLIEKVLFENLNCFQ